MAEDASAGKLYLDVVADVSGLRKDAEAKLKTALAGLKTKAKAEVEFSRVQVRNAVNDALREVSKDSKVNTVKVPVAFDARQVRRALNDALKEAAASSNPPTVTVKVDVDDAAARRQLDRLSGRERLTVETSADTSGAERDVDGLKQRVRGKPIDVPLRIPGNALSEITSAVTGLARFPALASGIMVAAGAVANLAGGLYALTASASQAVGVLAAIPNAIGVAAQGLGTLMLGFSGVGDAVKALGKAQQQAGASAARSGAQQEAAANAISDAQERLARAQEAAAERVTEAQRRVADAQRQAMERVRAARESLARTQEAAAERAARAEQRVADVQEAGAQRIIDAQRRVSASHRTVQQAVNSLSEATERATERAQDLALQLAGAALDEEAAELALERAANRLRDISSPGAVASDLDKREADLAYRQALHRLDQIRESNEDLAKEKAELDRTGIEGSREVVAAQERLNNALQAERDARQELAKVNRDVARDIAAAQNELAKVQRDNARDVADAQRDVINAQQEGARRVADAQRDLLKAQRDGARQVADAQKAVARAMASAARSAGSASSAANALAEAMDNLSPAGQRFARFIKDTLEPRFQALRFAVQEALLPPLQRAITQALPLLDVIQKGLVGTGERIGALAEELAAMVSTPIFRKDVGAIMESNNRALTDFGKAGIAVVDILRRIAVVAGPVLLEPFAKWVRELAEAANASDKLTKSKIRDFLQRAADSAKTLSSIIGDVAKALYNVGRAGRPAGDTLLDSLADAADRLRKWTEDPANQKRMREFFDNAVPVMQQFGDLFNRVIALFLRLGEITGGGTLDGLFWILNRVLDVLEGIANVPGGGPIMTALLTLSGVGLGLGLVAKALGGIVGNVAKLAKYTGVTKLLKTLGDSKLGLAAKGAASAVASGTGGALKRGAQTAGEAVKRGARATKAVVSRGAQTAGNVVARTGSSAVSSLAGSALGQAAAAGLARAGAAAKTAATAVSGFVAQMARAGSAALMNGIKTAATTIGGVAAAAGRGALALAGLAAGYARAGAAALLSAGRQLAAATAAGVVRAATAAWTAAQWLLNAALNANPISLIVIAIAALVAGVIWAYNNVEWFRDGVNAVFKAVGAAASWFYNNAIKPVVDGIAAAAIWLYEKVLYPSFMGWKLLFEKVIAPAARWLWSSIIEPVFQSIGGLIKVIIGAITGNFELLRSGLTQIGNAWRTIWNSISSLLSTTWNNHIRPLLVTLGNFITKTVPESFRTGVDAIKKFWDRLKEFAKTPVAFVVNTVYNSGIRRVWNWIADKVNLGQLPEIKGFATGGIYPGYTPGKDVGLAAVSGGEAIMRPEWTRAVGSDFVHFMNRLARSGGVRAVRKAMEALMSGMPGFASGGIVDGAPLMGEVPFAGHFDIGGIVSSFIKAGKKFFANGLKKAITGTIDPIISLTDRTIGHTGFGKLIAGVPRAMRDKLIEWVMRFAGELEGGDASGVVAAAKRYIGRGDGTDGFSGPNWNIFNKIWGFGPGTPWCSNFVSTAIKDAKAGKAYPGYPSAAVYGYYSKMKKVGGHQAKPGDLAVWGGPSTHINLVEKNLGPGKFQTIGGNENSLVRRATRYGAYAILRPGYARGGVVDRRVFTERNLGYDHDKLDPLYRLLASMKPTVADHVSRAMAKLPSWLLNRDSGGPLYPGLNLVDNSTGGLEWVLTDRAVDMLGGPAAVHSLNLAADLHRAGRATPALPRTATAPRDNAKITQNIYPQPRQSEHEIAMISVRKIGQLLR